MNQEEMFTILKEQGDKIYSYKLFWDFCKKLLEMFDFYESENRKEHYQVEVRACRDEDIVEIDTFKELKAIDKTYDV